MNKPSLDRQNLAHQATRQNKVNRNLSPSFAKIQAQKSQTPPPGVSPPSREAVHTAENSHHTQEPRQAPLPPTRIHHAVAGQSSHGENTKQSALQADSSRSPGSNASRITPWVIASITLTLALFSGNYAWHTQQDLETLNLRFEQFEAQTPAPAVADLDNSSDNNDKTHQELLSLSEAQGQLSTTITTLQSTVQTDTEQVASRLTELENTLAALRLQIQEATLNQKHNKPPIGQATKAPATNSETTNDTKTADAADKSEKVDWYITIASFSDPSAASNVHQKIQKIADTASITPITINGKTLYRIRADGYDSRKDAEREAQTLQAQFGLSGLWVSRD